jgi:hypothetical protein
LPSENATVAKSEKKTGRVPSTAFKPGPDPRRGRGPAPGAPNAGRPPSELRAAMRLALADRIQIAADIADREDATDADKLRALDFLARHGMAQQHEHAVADSLAALLGAPAVTPTSEPAE